MICIIKCLPLCFHAQLINSKRHHNAIFNQHPRAPPTMPLSPSTTSSPTESLTHITSTLRKELDNLHINTTKSLFSLEKRITALSTAYIHLSHHHDILAAKND